MHSATNLQSRRKLLAYILPMIVFCAFLALVGVLKGTGDAFWLRAPEYWLFPLQTACAAGVLLYFWREYEFHGLKGLPVVLVVGFGVFVLWIAPQAFFGSAARVEGFNPDTFAAQPAAYWATVILRFVRLVIVVPLVEEIFWRGFLLRYFINDKFETVPFGAFSWLSFVVVCVGFMLVHQTADWPAALITGALYNFVAYRTRSLLSCVLTHALTNLLLGLWIMRTGQWGFW